ncbi:IPIL1 protein, partial [Bucorvus abyssinicus]|nr:IPIL1 protein [Bucorvus abyssinicus]
GCIPREYHAAYRVLVLLKAPRGPSFHLELGTTGEVPSKASRICVELECTCVREQLEEDMLCFLRDPEEKLSRNQAPSLLDALCIGSYLDPVKTTCWFQKLVKSAWVYLPELKDCHLTVLPSSRSCQFRLTCISDHPVLIEMVFGVEEDDSDTITT